MERLDKDELFTLAKNSNVRDLLSLCITNKRFNQLICENANIWKYLLKRDYDFDYVGPKNPKKLYLNLLKC